jgi:hypothetical protein
MHPAFQYNQYHLRRQVLALTGKLRLYSPSGELVLYSQQKMFRLREDIRAYTDETKAQELLHIQARQMIDFSAYYDVFDSTMSQPVGTLRRQGLKSLARDTWQVLDPSGAQIGIMQEDSMQLALLRRIIAGSLIPQNYDLMMGDHRVADLRQRFNPFRYELDLDFQMDPGHRLDRRVGIAAALLLAIIEGHQE